MKTELFIPLYIDEHKTHYEISNKGRIRNVKTNRIISQYLQDGYLKSSLKYNNSYRSFNIALLMVENFKNKRKNDDNCLYFKDNNRMNLDLDNIDIIDIDELYKLKTQSLFRVNDDGKLELVDGNFIDEIWKTLIVNDHKTSYVISSYGRVLNVKSGLFINPVIPKNGDYPFIILRFYGKSYRFTMHRLIAKLFVDNPNENIFKVVNHLNENKQDFRASNLEWTDNHGNSTYSVIKHERYGENTVNAKINEQEAIKICEMLSEGYKMSEIVSTLGVSRNIVRHIKDGKTWKYISCKYNFNNDISKFIEKENENYIIKLREAGRTYDEISNITNNSKRVIYRVLKNNNMTKSRDRIFINDDIRSKTEINILKLYKYNVPIPDISDILGITENKIISILINNNIIL